ncbi:MAG: class I SAM-dependent methyltransferase [Pseudomonadota bacterium]
MTNATIFGSKAKVYREARPGYPGALFDWIAEEAPAREVVWDCATGSGQAAVSLSERFAKVMATDISAEQIAEAEQRANIQYRVAPAEASGLDDTSVDVVTVATALHWFDFPQFWPEVERVLRPGGVFAGWTYGFIATRGAVQETFLDPFYTLIDPFWSEGNRMAVRGYTDDVIGCPFAPLIPPSVQYNEDWPIARLIGFAESWSGTMRARSEGGLGDQLDQLIEEAAASFAHQPVPISMPLHVLAGRR